MKRLLTSLVLAATLFLIGGAPEAQALIQPIQDDLGCVIEILQVVNSPGGGYSIIIGERCNDFSAVCLTRYDRYGNQIGEIECEFIY